MNAQLAAAGQAPTEIFTKTFFDTFVLMGGCGSALCLLIAILVTSKRRNVKKLAKISLAPMLFNINELLLFGLPVIFNPMLLIPFILTPILLTLTSCFAVATGLVGCTVQSVHWTTPVLLSGYAATGSVAGSVLQLINLAVGILTYLPFVRISQERYMHTLTGTLKNNGLFGQHEARGIEPALLVRRIVWFHRQNAGFDLRMRLKTRRAPWYQPRPTKPKP
ncbi:MAG: PTS transporter subunit EIIC [Oscillospiraceae bacterium]